MHCMVLYEGQLTDHSHPRLPSQGRATRSHPHLGDVALVKRRGDFFYLIFFRRRCCCDQRGDGETNLTSVNTVVDKVG